MSETMLFEVEHDDSLTLLRMHMPDSGLIFTDAKSMEALWKILDSVAFKKTKVLLLLTDSDFLSPIRVEQLWEEIEKDRSSKSVVLPQLLAAQTSICKLIEYTKMSQTLCITAVSGAIDFDLLGLFTTGHYRVCSNDTVFENHVVDRSSPPGSWR